MSQLRVELGNPQSPVSVSFLVDVGAAKKVIEKQTVGAAETLKTAFEAWKQWSLENESDVERRMRIANEKLQEQQLRSLEQAAAGGKARSLLDGPA